MERIQGHLRGRLAHTLRTDAANHLTRVYHRRSEHFTNLSDELIESYRVKSVLLDYLLRIEVLSEEDFEKLERIFVSFTKDGTLLDAKTTLRNDTKLVLKLIHLFKVMMWVKVRHRVLFYVIESLYISDNSGQIDGHRHHNGRLSVVKVL